MTGTNGQYWNAMIKRMAGYPVYNILFHIYKQKHYIYSLALYCANLQTIKDEKQKF